jgi:hypothetical protein
MVDGQIIFNGLLQRKKVDWIRPALDIDKGRAVAKILLKILVAVT